MSKEKNYVDILLSDEKYLNELVKMYDVMQSDKRTKRKLDKIEQTLARYSEGLVPDYTGFYTYAINHYSPKKNESLVQSRYKNLLCDSNIEDFSDHFYCLVLFGHFSEEINSFSKKHEKDFDSLPKEQQMSYNVLYFKFKLLYGFLRNIESLSAMFVNSIDIQETEHLDDDIKKLDSTAIKYRFMRALQKRDKTMAFKLLGRIRELDEGEDYYFEALSHYINEEYEEALRYIDKINKKDIDYPSATALKLELYSNMGDITSFFNCINANISMTFECSHIVYLLMNSLLRTDPKKYKFDPAYIETLTKINFSEQEPTYYNGLIRQLVANIIVEGFEIIETNNNYSQIIDDFVMPAEKTNRLEILYEALSIGADDFSKYLDLNYLENKNFNDVKSEAEEKLLKLLIDNNPDGSFENLRIAFITQLKLGNTATFIDNVCSNYDVLKSYSEQGETGAEELFRLAYTESAISGTTINEKLKQYIESNPKIDLSADISNKKIMNILSPQGKIAYESAECQFNQTNETDYGWKDAGMLSLSYYRIFEVELNQKFIIPLLKGIGYQNLNNEFNNCANTLSGTDKSEYKKKWNKIIKTYQEMEKNSFSGNGFMLGVMDHFFRAIGSDYDSNDTLADSIINHLGDILTTEGINKFHSGFFEAITGEGTRNKYRNPPAHTRYLPYRAAFECRELFRETILQFEHIFKS